MGAWGQSRGAAGYWIPDQVRDDGGGWEPLKLITLTGVVPGEDPGTNMLSGAVGLGAPLIAIPSPTRGKGGSFGKQMGKGRGAAGYWIPDQVRDDGGGWEPLKLITLTGVVPGEDPGTSMLGGVVG